MINAVQRASKLLEPHVASALPVDVAPLRRTHELFLRLAGRRSGGCPVPEAQRT